MIMKSRKANEIFLTVSPIYEKSKIMHSIFETIGSELDNSNKYVEEIKKQLFPQSSTWGIDIWEQKLGLVTNKNEAIERRRGKVIAKLQSNYIITPERMAMIISNYTGADIEIIENVAPYTFEIKLTGREGFPKSLEDLYKNIKQIKPAHLTTKYTLISITQSKFYLAATTLAGEEVIVYPLQTRQIQTKGTINVTIYQSSSLENIKVYPFNTKEIQSKGTFNVAMYQSSGIENITLYPKEVN